MAFPKRKNLQEQRRQKLIIVGSKNPVKIKCTEHAFQALFEDHFIVQGLDVGDLGHHSTSRSA
jgi:inosine/xanthosine triphosphatase